MIVAEPAMLHLQSLLLQSSVGDQGDVPAVPASQQPEESLWAQG